MNAVRGGALVFLTVCACGRPAARADVHAPPTAATPPPTPPASSAPPEGNARVVLPRGDGLVPETAGASATVRVTHARFGLRLPDERDAPLDRELTLDDDVVHARATLGEHLWTPPGVRIEGRAGLADFALVPPDRRSYVVRTPDELSRWFLGEPATDSAVLSFRRSDQTVVATRRSLSLVLFGDRDGPARPVTCRLLVALLLGGESGAARAGCARATIPTRITLRADGWLALQWDRRSLGDDDQPATALTVPPAGARFDADLDLPIESHGAFRSAGSDAGELLDVVNAFQRAAILFVDEAAFAWLGAGEHATFAGLPAGMHHARARSIDGVERTRLIDARVPGRIAIHLPPPLVGPDEREP